jgi:hypothetical protein
MPRKTPDDMSDRTPKKRFSPIAALNVLLIGLTVFGWGLYYKLSLYQAPQSVTHLAPHAKLLSQKERTAVPDGIAADGSLDDQWMSDQWTTQMRPAADFPVALLWLAAAMLVTSLSYSRAIISGTQPLRVLGRACCGYFFFRPPPASL